MRYLKLLSYVFIIGSLCTSFNYLFEGRRETGWLVFKEYGGVLFAQDSLDDNPNTDKFFDKYQYLKGIDVSYNGSIYDFESRATSYKAKFYGDKTTQVIKILPVTVKIYSRKSSLNAEINAWSFKRKKDSTIIIYHSPDTLYVSNICPYQRMNGKRYSKQTCSQLQ